MSIRKLRAINDRSDASNKNLFRKGNLHKRSILFEDFDPFSLGFVVRLS